MATDPLPDEPQPTVAQRARRAVVAPVARNERVVLLAVAAAAATLAPVPFGAIAVVALVVVASEARRR